MWKYKNKPISEHSDLMEGCTDFVYRITYTNGQIYIGKKNVKSIRKRKPLKGKKRNRRLLISHPFVNYEGSHESAKNLVIKTKEILYQCSTKKAATYLEAALLFHYDSIFDPNFLNENIHGTFFKESLDGLLK